MITLSSYLNLCLCLSCFKFLFMKSYVSTDFDVHRNWMAITHNLPMSEWYFDTTSKWTLDYPPLFAAYEFLLSLVADVLGLKDAVELTEESIRTQAVIIYQKATVIVSDYLYYYAVYHFCQSLSRLSKRKTAKRSQEQKLQPITKIDPTEIHQHITDLKQNLIESLCKPDDISSIALMMILQPGLMLVDHIHFQYNGLLSGLFLLAVSNIIRGHFAMGSFWFVLLLNMKHIYLYYAPAFGMYLLTSYCFALPKRKRSRIINSIRRILKLALVVLSVMIITYLPFSTQSNLEQIISRLFPFKRGLTHAYWAPNIWALYNSADKILATVYKDSIKVVFDLTTLTGTNLISSTSGLVQEYEHKYLPSISPFSTFVLVAIFTVPMVLKFLTKINKRSSLLFLKSLTLAAFTSFMFGWHVHEKAIILVLLGVIPIAFLEPKLKNLFLRLTLAGTYSLFPLLFEPGEYLTKLTILLTYYFYARSMCKKSRLRKELKGGRFRQFMLRVGGTIYYLFDILFLGALSAVEAYTTLIHGRLNPSWSPFKALSKYEFLPLMLVSSLSAIGITFSYLELYYDFVFGSTEEDVDALD